MIHRALQKNKDRVPMKNKYASIPEFYEAIQKTPSCLKMVDKQGVETTMTAELISSSTKTFHMALHDERLVKQLLENDVFADATFSICPNVDGVKQIFVIMGKKCGVVSVKTSRNKFNVNLHFYYCQMRLLDVLKYCNF